MSLEKCIVGDDTDDEPGWGELIEGLTDDEERKGFQIRAGMFR